MFKSFFGILILFFVSSLYADESISLSVANNNIELYESFELRLSVEWDISWEIEVPWIENFEVVSQERRSEFRNIQGTSLQKQYYTLVLRATKVWNYTLWPIEIMWENTSLIDDEIETIQVQDSFSLQRNKNWSSIEKNQESEEKIEMEELKGLREKGFPFLLVFSVLVVFFIIFFFLLALIFKKKEKIPAQIQTQKIIKDQQGLSEKYIEIFQKLWEQNLDLSTEEFFREFHSAIRNFLDESGYKGAKYASLQQLQKYPSKLISVMTETYNYEFSKKELSQEIKKKKIQNLIKILEDDLN